MLSLCYAQCLGYLFCTMFPSLSILQHYVEFNTHTIFTLEKLLNVGPFEGCFDHLVHCQTIFFISLGGLSLPFVVRIATPRFLKCWALIAFTFIIHFQHDDHPILLDVVAHVEINTSPFQMTL